MIKTVGEVGIEVLITEGAYEIPAEIIKTLGEAGIYGLIAKGLMKSQQR